MAAKRKTKITFDLADIDFVVKKDGKIIAVENSNSFVCINENGNSRFPDAETLSNLLGIGNELNGPKGYYYDLTLQILANYRLFALMREKRQTVFTGFSEDKDITFSSDEPIKLMVYDNQDLADIMNLVVMRSSGYRQELARFIRRPTNVILSYEIIRIVSSGVDLMRTSGMQDLEYYGQLIHDRFINPDYVGENATFFYKLAKKQKSAYNENLMKGVTFLSKYLFGFFPGDQNVLCAEITKEGITFRSVLNKE